MIVTSSPPTVPLLIADKAASSGSEARKVISVEDEDFEDNKCPEWAGASPADLQRNCTWLPSGSSESPSIAREPRDGLPEVMRYTLSHAPELSPDRNEAR